MYKVKVEKVLLLLIPLDSGFGGKHCNSFLGVWAFKAQTRCLGRNRGSATTKRKKSQSCVSPHSIIIPCFRDPSSVCGFCVPTCWWLIKWVGVAKCRLSRPGPHLTSLSPSVSVSEGPFPDHARRSSPRCSFSGHTFFLLYLHLQSSNRFFCANL